MANELGATGTLIDLDVALLEERVPLCLPASEELLLARLTRQHAFLQLHDALIVADLIRLPDCDLAIGTAAPDFATNLSHMCNSCRMGTGEGLDLITTGTHIHVSERARGIELNDDIPLG